MGQKSLYSSQGANCVDLKLPSHILEVQSLQGIPLQYPCTILTSQEAADRNAYVVTHRKALFQLGKELTKLASKSATEAASTCWMQCKISVGECSGVVIRSGALLGGEQGPCTPAFRNTVSTLGIFNVVSGSQPPSTATSTSTHNTGVVSAG